MSPNLYDLLDVDEAAGTDEIRAAWRRAIEDLEPTDRRFRAYNDAAAVLLDPAKREAYDAELAAARADEAAADEASADQPAASPVGSGAQGSEAEERGGTEEPTSAGGATRASGASAVRHGPANGTLIAAGIAAVLSAALAIWLLTLPGTTAEHTPQERREQAAELRETAGAAEDAAAEIVVPVLSYDYRTLDEDLEEALTHLTDSYAEQHERLFEELRPQARSQRIVVTAAVAGTAVTRVAEDGQRASVVLFVNQDVRKRGAEPTVLRMSVTANLVREDGGWLLDELCTEGGCG